MIRPAQREDLEGMLPLLQQLFGIEEDFQFDAQKQRRGLELLFDSPTSIVMVAKEQHLVIGMGTGQLVISTSEGGPSLLVEDVVVVPAWQNHGIGKKLLQALGDWGRERNARRMQLLADKSNSLAIGFYSHNGWHQTQLICLRKFHLEKERT